MRAAPPRVSVRRRFRVGGVVQGVGFRPFVHRLAARFELGGFVLNDGEGVMIEAEGEAASLDGFAAALSAEAPPLARMELVSSQPLTVRGDRNFVVAGSRATTAGALVPPDVATCEDCLRELFDRDDRRFGHPFITCTNCGPRFTIVEGTPYDRRNTSMAVFEMCEDCRSEYEDPADRRFHAETICCPACGPRLSMPVQDAADVIRAGGIVAVKGLGGYHLACDASNEWGVGRLRSRKRRDDKPFAVMTTDPEDLVDLDQDERALLFSTSRPIVLARRRDHLAPSVAPGTERLGVMVPYTPVHHLLLRAFGAPLVMTSGNQSDEPIASDDAEAQSRLGAIADVFLSHDRTIRRRCEDSVVSRDFPLRRSRGYTPSALALPVRAVKPMLAVGAELKSTFCVARDRDAFLSGHLGDLSSPSSWTAFQADRELYLDMLGVRPSVIAHDLHPEYLSTKWAIEQDAECIGVQHHHAHAAACLAEHGEREPALAVVLDGTGYGVDGTLWGGEVLRCDLLSFDRVAHLEAIALPGGEAAVREPWRVAASYLEAAGTAVPFPRWTLVRQSLGVNAPLSSGAGRLLDAVAAILGVRERISYEGQAAIELEQLAGAVRAHPYACDISDDAIRGADLVRAVVEDLADGRPREEIAAAVHDGLADAFARACEAAADPRTVVLSGGCLQNRRIAARLRTQLEASGFRVLSHHRVPPNDGGIAYGQAVVAAARSSSCA